MQLSLGNLTGKGQRWYWTIIIIGLSQMPFGYLLDREPTTIIFNLELITIKYSDRNKTRTEVNNNLIYVGRQFIF